MKKMTKTQKVVLGSSLAFLTLVPVVAVAATSCSDQNKKGNSNSQKPTPQQPSQNNKEASTKSTDVQSVINDFKDAESLNKITQLLQDKNQLLAQLELTPSQAQINNVNQTNFLVSFTVQLIEKNLVFDSQLIQSPLQNTTITANSITFNIPIPKNLTNTGNYVNLDIAQVYGLTSKINEITNLQQAETQFLNQEGILKYLGLKTNSATVEIQTGAPVNYQNKNYVSETVVITLLNQGVFKSDLISQLQKNSLGISVTPNSISYTNIRTSIVNNKNIEVNLNLNNLSSYFNQLSNLYSLDELQNNTTNQAIASQLGTNLGYLNIQFSLNEQETQKNKVKTYDLTISPKQGCVFDNKSIEQYVSGKQNVSYNQQKQTLVFSNIQTGIYLTTNTLQTLNSSIFDTNSISGVQSKLKSTNLVSQINQSLTSQQDHKLPDDSILVNQKVLSSTNAIQLTFASKTQKAFNIITIQVSPSQLSKLFGESSTISNDLNQVQSISKPNAIITNASLSADKIDLNNFGLLETKKQLVSVDSIQNSTNIAKAFEQYTKTANIQTILQNQVLYDALKVVNQINQQLNQTTSSSNTFIQNSLHFTSNNGNLVLGGKLTIQIANNTNSPKNISVDNALLNNASPYEINANGYVLVSYDFDGVTIVPKVVQNTSGEWVLSYGFNNVKETLLNNTDIDQEFNSTKPTNINSFMIPSSINVTIGGVASGPNYFDTNTQKTFDTYLSSLSTEKIKTELQTQDNALWKFIQAMGADVGDVFTLLGTNPTLGGFITGLSAPLTDVVTQLTNNQELGQLIGGLISNQPVLTYVKNNASTIKNIANWVVNYLKNNGIINKISPNINLAVTNIDSNLINLSSSSTNIGQDFMNVIKEYMKSPNFKKLATWLIDQLKNINNSIIAKESIIEILGKDIQPILKDIIAQTSDQSANPAWKFLYSINELLESIENSQQVQNIYNVKLFDILKNKVEGQAIIDFCNNGLKPFMQIVNVSGVTQLDKAINIMTKIFELVPKLNLQKPELIFQALANLSVNVNGKSTQITWKQLFDQYIEFVPVINVSSYNTKTHQVSYTNELSFKFKNDVTLNLANIKTQLDNLTVGNITDALGVDLNKVLPSAVSKFIPAEKLKSVKVAEILPNTMTVYENDGAKVGIISNNDFIQPTIVNNHVTWYTNNIMILDTSFKSTSDHLINDLMTNITNVATKLVNVLLQIPLKIALNNLKGSITTFVDGYTNSNYNFNVGWVNKIGLSDNPVIKNYNSNVQNLNYKLIQKNDINQKEIHDILVNSKYQSNIASQINDMQGIYIQSNPELTSSILNQLFDSQTLEWINNDKVPAYMKPTISVQYTTDKTISLFNIKLADIKGSYVIQVKLPFKALVSTDNGKTWQLTDTYTYTIPYTMPNK